MILTSTKWIMAQSAHRQPPNQMDVAVRRPKILYQHRQDMSHTLVRDVRQVVLHHRVITSHVSIHDHHKIHLWWIPDEVIPWKTQHHRQGQKQTVKIVWINFIRAWSTSCVRPSKRAHRQTRRDHENHIPSIFHHH